MKRILSVLFLLSSASVYGVNPALDSLMLFAGNIHQFNAAFPQEKVYIEFDNTSYYTGETIWFKAFVVGASMLDRAPSKVLYVDLISPNGVLLKQEKLKIVAGQADGSLPLIDGSTKQARDIRGIMNYPSGYYEVRAYTTNMLNFSQDAIFSRVFAVYEQPEKDGAYYEQPPVIKMRKSDVEQYRPKVEKQKDYNVSFFPEGGQSVIGAPSRVAFRVTDQTGMGVDASGYVNDTEVSFSTLHCGMGSFVYYPTSTSNKVTLLLGNSASTFDLSAMKSGYTMLTDGDTTDSLMVKVYCSPDISTSEMLGLSLTCRGELMAFETISPEITGAERIITLDGVPEGVCRLTLFNRHGHVLAVRSVYHHGTTLSPNLSFTTDKPQYTPFEKIQMKLSLTDNNGLPFRDRFCLSVRDVRGMSNKFADDIRTYMLLSSDIKGLIEAPDYYFEADDSIHRQALNLLMLVQGWERYDWQTMAGVKEFREIHRLETGLSLNGWVLNPSGRKPLDEVEVLAAVVPENKMNTELFSYKTDSSGYFGFDITNDFYNTAVLTINTKVKKERLLGTNARIKFERSLVPDIRAYQAGETVFSDKQMILNKKKPTQVEIYSPPTVIDQDMGFLLEEVNIKSSRIFVDYYTFKAFDVTKDVEVELDNAEYSTDVTGYLIDKGYQVGFDDSTINGMPVFWYVHDTKKVIYQGIYENPFFIDTKDINSIIVFDKVMSKSEAIRLAPLYSEYLNRTLQNPAGDETMMDYVLMVDIQLKEESQRSTRKELFNIDKRVTTMQGFSVPYAFFSPSYPDGPILGDVDYRRTLYWNPNVITDSLGNAQVEFYNNSISAHYNVSAAGITSTGRPYLLNEDF